MHQKDLKPILSSLPIPAVPEGLEAHVLKSVHFEQRKELRRFCVLHQLQLIGLTLSVVVSAVIVIHRFASTGAAKAVETVVLNLDVLSLKDTVFVLLEVLPIGGISIVLVMATFLCLSLTLKRPKTHVSFNLHVPSLTV